jgi:hypothetical protein
VKRYGPKGNGHGADRGAINCGSIPVTSGRLRTPSGTVLCCHRGFAVLAIWQSAVALVLRRRIARLAAAVGQRAAAAG